MNSIIPYLPTIFCYWTSILIAWSAISALGMFQIIRKIKSCGYETRSSDHAALWLSIIGGIAGTVILFGLPDLVALVMDVMIALNVWYTLFMGYLSWSSLSGWPIVMQYEHPRHSKRPHLTEL